jgi:hypothetical protein
VISWRDLGGPALRLGTATSRAVQAAAARQPERYREAAAALALLPAEQAGTLLAAVLRALLEERHPDGLDRGDIQAVVSRCHRAAAGWLPVGQIRVTVLIAALASALGIHEPGVTYHDGVSTVDSHVEVPTAEQYLWHGPLLIADLLAAGSRPLGTYLDRAFGELSQEQTSELP